MKQLMAVSATDKVYEQPELEEYPKEFDTAWDDVNNKLLDPSEVRKARRDEMGYIEEKQVWEKRSREYAKQNGYKIVDTRWIDTDKGDETTPCTTVAWWARNS